MKWLLDVLSDVASHEQENKMNPRHIGIKLFL